MTDENDDEIVPIPQVDKMNFQQQICLEDRKSESNKQMEKI
jgi:hypothetical protein